MNLTAKRTNSARLRVGLPLACVWLAFSGSAFAQSAEAFGVDAPSETKQPESKKKEKLPAPKAVDPVPSRFAGQDLESYVSARAAVFSMRDRETDPFGLYQDPDAKPVERKIVSQTPNRRQAALPPTPLAEIVKRIQVTTIMPGEKKFLVGIRSFEESDEFQLQYRGKSYRMKVMEVSARTITFRDLDKGENAVLETEMLPPGMVAGGGQLRPAGMVSPESELPLKIESSESLDSPGSYGSPNN